LWRSCSTVPLWIDGSSRWVLKKSPGMTDENQKVIRATRNESRISCAARLRKKNDNCMARDRVLLRLRCFASRGAACSTPAIFGHQGAKYHCTRKPEFSIMNRPFRSTSRSPQPHPLGARVPWLSVTAQQPCHVRISTEHKFCSKQPCALSMERL